MHPPTNYDSNCAPIYDPTFIPLTFTIWNSTGLPRSAISAVTNTLQSSSLLFITETWLLPSLQYHTHWQQYHTYAVPVSSTYRGQMGITLLVNPDCPFSVAHLPSTSLYSLSCQVSHFLIHCLYLPPSLSDEECIQVLNDLPLSSNSSQTNTIFCGDFNARHRQILGDSLTSPRGHRVFDWANNLGLTCWNEQLAKGVPTYYTQHRNQIKKSIINLFFSLTDELINPRMEVIQNSHMGSTHFPVSLSLLCAQTPIGQPNHPRLLWKLAKLQELPVRQLYQDLFAIKASPLLADLRDLVKYSIDLYKGRIDNSFTSTQDSSSSFSLDIDDLTKPRLSSNAWYWTDNLQSLFDARENAHRQWRRATPGSIGKALLWKEYRRMYQSFTVELKRQRPSSFEYLGIPFNTKAQVNVSLLIRQNARSALTAMHAGFSSLGFFKQIRFSKLTAARLYSIFIRPKLEYGICLGLYRKSDFATLEHAQDTCLRLCINSHSKGTTGSFKLMTNLPSLAERKEYLVFKMMIRFETLPEDTLIMQITTHIDTYPFARQTQIFLWPQVSNKNHIWLHLSDSYNTLSSWVEADGNAKKQLLGLRQRNLNALRAQTNAPVLLSACRPFVGQIDPPLLLPMSIYDRQRVLRWRLGWIPKYTSTCSCGTSPVSRRHVLGCLRAAERLRLPADIQPNLIDYVLNQLPRISRSPSLQAQRLDRYTRWSNWWPTISQLLLEIETIDLPDKTFSSEEKDTSGPRPSSWKQILTVFG
ncbi:uncharacterized protein B0P05DRAFT_591798 [Gilbertella persicaria]|uniref:uncharacterized protein n=1 Tax=Gilbertella persicaria TaxID=101096 RepID=UPI00221F0FFD|nr:uncharacterized protein B0P05DRAFT_591798 [Gilbertella persicaria]KAI8051885.1 hypothetical protein B0P05DRAFT_591798 [Gilbertella persicaria]